MASTETVSGFVATFPKASPAGVLTVTGVVEGTLAKLTVSAGSAEELFVAASATDLLTITAHDFTDGDELYLEGSDLPAPLGQGRTYYVRDKDTNDFKVTEIKDKDGDLGDPIDIIEDGKGLVGHDYVVQARVTTSEAQTLDGEVVVRVRSK